MANISSLDLSCPGSSGPSSKFTSLRKWHVMQNTLPFGFLISTLKSGFETRGGGWSSEAGMSSSTVEAFTSTLIVICSSLKARLSLMQEPSLTTVKPGIPLARGVEEKSKCRWQL